MLQFSTHKILLMDYIKMDKDDLEKLRYPVGKFEIPETYTQELRNESIAAIRAMPEKIIEATKGLDDGQLSEPYREGGWCIRQMVHHLADSHMNSFIRFKLALTEDNPQIKAYDQDAWAKGIDATYPMDSSIKILEGVHDRLATVMENMSPEDYDRTLFHPEWDKNLTLDFMSALYGWHSVHHLTQIIELRKRKGW